MKKGWFVLIIILFCLPVFSVKAAESVSFSTDSITCKNNRLIEVNVNAACGKRLSAALFEFSFNKSVLEFRGVKSPDGTRVVYHEKSDCVKLSYLCADGAEIANGAAVFTLKFKSVGEGDADFGYTVYDCVDADVQQLSVGSCTAGAVTVTAKASDSVGTAENTKSTAGAAADSTAVTVEQTDAEEVTLAESRADSGLIRSFPPKESTNWIAVAVLCCSLAAAAAATGFLIGKHTHKKNKNQDSSDD